jgi:hypothetical protein
MNSLLRYILKGRANQQYQERGYHVFRRAFRAFNAPLPISEPLDPLSAALRTLITSDNIMMYWDPPIRASSDEIIGLYGYNEKLILRVGTFKVPKCALLPSNGTATVRGVVSYNGRPVGGATVRIGCRQTMSQPEKGYYEIQVPAGRYLVTATYTDRTTGWGLDGNADTNDMAGGSSSWIPIDLQDPPPQRRKVIVSGTMDLRDAYLGGMTKRLCRSSVPPCTQSNS